MVYQTGEGERPQYGLLLVGDTPKYHPRVTVQAEHRGPMRIRFVYWKVIGSRTIFSKRITWNDDGTPVIPPQTSWHERVELEHIVEVVE